jgi:hypothetical protein
MNLTDGEDEWEQLNRTNWRGLGLTDPIKNIEVCLRLRIAQFLKYRSSG